MTSQEAIAKLRECQAIAEDDREIAHNTADKVLCELLKTLGYGDVVAEWEAFDKWYA